MFFPVRLSLRFCILPAYLLLVPGVAGRGTGLKLSVFPSLVGRSVDKAWGPALRASALIPFQSLSVFLLFLFAGGAGDLLFETCISALSEGLFVEFHVLAWVGVERVFMRASGFKKRGRSETGACGVYCGDCRAQKHMGTGGGKSLTHTKTEGAHIWGLP